MMKTVDISGMGRGYEHVCQQMLRNGEEFSKSNREIMEKAIFKGYEGIYGVLRAHTPEAEILEKAMMKGLDDVTVQMHQSVVGHLMIIASKGRQYWLDETERLRPGRTFEWDGTVESCPEGPFTPEEEEKIKATGREFISRAIKGDTILAGEKMEEWPCSK